MSMDIGTNLQAIKIKKNDIAPCAIDKIKDPSFAHIRQVCEGHIQTVNTSQMCYHALLLFACLFGSDILKLKNPDNIILSVYHYNIILCVLITKDVHLLRLASCAISIVSQVI